MNKLPAIKVPKITAEIIMYGLALANAFRLAWAYAYADADGNVLSLPGGFGLLLGMFISIGTAFVAGKIPGVRGKIRTALSWTSLAVLLLLEPMILAPLTYTDMPVKLSMNIPGAWGWGWSIVLTTVPSIVMIAIAFTGGNLVSNSTEKPLDKPEKPVVKNAEPAYYCQVSGCSGNKKTKDGSFGSQAALNAHMVSHKPKVIGYEASFKPVIAKENKP